ncbi:MAG: carboxymuconolactone decarboxylase family protein [Armatimonadota bacterium]|nr:carboxymuconolactone decarboxylase family protein [Armatimonadota bacterium]
MDQRRDETLPVGADRVARGRRMREEIMGPGVPPGTPATQELAPFFSEWVYASVFGDLYGRPQLDLKTRVLITLVALSVQGRSAQLRGYVGAALRLGWTRDEIVEAIVQLAPYQGVPATHDALAAAKEVFDRQRSA